MHTRETLLAEYEAAKTEAAAATYNGPKGLTTSVRALEDISSSKCPRTLKTVIGEVERLRTLHAQGQAALSVARDFVKSATSVQDQEDLELARNAKAMPLELLESLTDIAAAEDAKASRAVQALGRAKQAAEFDLARELEQPQTADWLAEVWASTVPLTLTDEMSMKDARQAQAASDVAAEAIEALVIAIDLGEGADKREKFELRAALAARPTKLPRLATMKAETAAVTKAEAQAKAEREAAEKAARHAESRLIAAERLGRTEEDAA